MFPSMIRTVSPQIRTALGAQSTRQMSVISGPPVVRISLVEKIAHGLAIAGGMLTIPVWVLVNLQNYKNKE